MSDINKSYMSIHNHSIYSNTRFGDAINTPSKMLDDFKKKGVAGFALTDHQSLSGHIPLLRAMKQKKQKNPHYFDNLKVLLGDEIYLVDKQKMNHYRKSDDAWHKDRKAYWKAQDNAHLSYKEKRAHPFKRPYPYPHFYHFITVANNNNGYKILQKLNRDAWKNSFKNGKGYKSAWRQQRLPTYKDDLAKLMKGHRGDLTVSTACLGSETSHDILSGNTKDMKHFLGYLDKTFGKQNTYFELMPAYRTKDGPSKQDLPKVKKMLSLEKQNDGRLPDDAQDKYGKYTRYNQWYVNKKLAKIGKETGHKTIISTDSHFMGDKDEALHEKVLKSESPSRDIYDFYHYAHTFSPESLKKYFPKNILDKSFKNSRSIMNKVKPISPKVVLGNKWENYFTNDITHKATGITNKLSHAVIKNHQNFKQNQAHAKELKAKLGSYTDGSKSWRLKRKLGDLTDNIKATQSTIKSNTNTPKLAKYLNKYSSNKYALSGTNMKHLSKEIGPTFANKINDMIKPHTKLAPISHSSSDMQSDILRNAGIKPTDSLTANTTHHVSQRPSAKESLPHVSKQRKAVLSKQRKFIEAMQRSQQMGR